MCCRGSDWSLLDRDVLNWLVGEDERTASCCWQYRKSLDHRASSAALLTRRDKKTLRINAALEAMETSHDQASAIAADKAFHLAILDATHNPVLQGFRGAIDTILSAVFVVAVGSVDGWFEDNYAEPCRRRRAIDRGDAEKARIAWSGSRKEKKKREEEARRERERER